MPGIFRYDTLNRPVQGAALFAAEMNSTYWIHAMASLEKAFNVLHHQARGLSAVHLLGRQL